MNSKALSLIGAGALFILLGGVMKKTTRGIRNNNPGNIRLNKTNWVGMRDKQTDPEFVQFKTPEYGIRALYRTLLTYQTKHGLNTISGIITRWAPPGENDTASYIKSVSRYVGVLPHEELGFFDYLKVVEGIINHENGQQPYSHQQIIKGVSLA